MGNNKNNISKIKNKFIKYRCTESERESLSIRAKGAGISVSDLIRSSLKSAKITIKNTDDIRNLAAQINRIGSNLNQLARWANYCKTSAECEQVLIRLRAIESAMLEVLSRC